MAKQGKTSKKQDNPVQSAARDASWSRGQKRKAERHALQVAAHETNIKNKKDGLPSDWEIACAKRAVSSQRRKARQHWIRSNQIPEGVRR